MVAVLVLACALPIALGAHVGAFFSWATPHRIIYHATRPYPAETVQGQLVYYWVLIGGWVIVWLSGFLLITRWSDRLRLPARIAVLLLPVVLGALMLGGPFSFQIRNPTPIATVEGLGHLVQMQFPPDTQLIEAKAFHTLDWAVAAKLTMPKQAVMPFIHGPFFGRLKNSPYLSNVRLAVSRTEPANLNFASQCGMTDWHPERLRQFVSADVGNAGQYVNALTADLSEPTMSTVYFVFAVY